MMRVLLRACPRRPCALHSSGSLRASRATQHTLRSRSDNTSPPPEPAGPEAPPFHGYLIDSLDAPLHTIAPATRSSPTPPPQDDPPQTPEEEKLAKARVVFGSRLAGPAERKREIEQMSTTIAGVLVPPRPEEPDNCCMSGCVNCVWDLYRDELEEWAEKDREAKQRMQAAGGGEEEGVGEGLTAMGGGGGGGGDEDLFGGIPVGIREFMRTEKMLKERKRTERSVAG